MTLARSRWLSPMMRRPIKYDVPLVGLGRPSLPTLPLSPSSFLPSFCLPLSFLSNRCNAAERSTGRSRRTTAAAAAAAAAQRRRTNSAGGIIFGRNGDGRCGGGHGQGGREGGREGEGREGGQGGGEKRAEQAKMIDFFGDVEKRIEKEEDEERERERAVRPSVRPSVGGCSCAVGRGRGQKT